MEEPEIESFGDPDVRSADAPIPRFLYWTYFLLPIWGFIVFLLFWNGSIGWSDRSYWAELQSAAHTKF